MTSKQRAQLRAQANTLEPIFFIGKEGITPSCITQANETFNTRELFKVKVHLETAPAPVKELAAALSEATKSEVVSVVGGTIVLFKINPILRQKEAEKKKRAAEKKKREAIERRTERNRRKYGSAK